ncbi:MAG: hypothetical protein NT010_13100 [Proteobacteria bacterium]|nr:hypothetical protein [Pseudomonadota bacterium]
MGFFSRNPRETQVPPRPSIDETAKFIEWMIRYHEDMEYLRRMLVPKVFEGFVPGMTKDMVRFLEKHNSAEKLIDKLGDARELYEKLQPILKQRNNDLNQCSQEIQVYFIDITTKMALIPYFLKYNYGSDFYFDSVGLKELQ